MRRRRAIAERSSAARGARADARLRQAMPFTVYHTMPRVFTAQEVRTRCRLRCVAVPVPVPVPECPQQHGCRASHGSYALAVCYNKHWMRTCVFVCAVRVRASQVATLNESRPKDDRLELLPSGLLRHHCAYPTCPDYLVNFATPKDRARGQRHGLLKHLKHNITLKWCGPTLWLRAARAIAASHVVAGWMQVCAFLPYLRTAGHAAVPARFHKVLEAHAPATEDVTTLQRDGGA